MQRGELRRVSEDKPEDPPKKPCTCQRFLSREQEDEGAVGSRPHCAWVEGAAVGLLSVPTLGQWLVQVSGCQAGSKGRFQFQSLAVPSCSLPSSGKDWAPSSLELFCNHPLSLRTSPGVAACTSHRTRGDFHPPTCSILSPPPINTSPWSWFEGHEVPSPGGTEIPSGCRTPLSAAVCPSLGLVHASLRVFSVCHEAGTVLYVYMISQTSHTCR